MILTEEKRRTRRKRVPVPLCTTNLTWTDLGSNRGLRDEKLAARIKLYIHIQLVPRFEHSVLFIKRNQLMLCREIIVCSGIHTKHINGSVGRTSNSLMLDLVVHNVITGR